jgi:hypothetical protein
MVKGRFDWVFNFCKELDEWVKFGSLKFFRSLVIRVHKLNRYWQILLNEKKKNHTIFVHTPTILRGAGGC